MSIKNGQARWVFDLSNWRPTLDELLKATVCIQPEEKARIGKFYFRNDFDSSLIGRLMLRKFVQLTTDQPYKQIKFDRDEKGKPFLVHSGIKTNPNQILTFNVSHQGRYTVLAGYSSKMDKTPHPICYGIGVDVTNTIYDGGKSLSEFFRIMTRNFSPLEWKYIRSQPVDEQSKAFMRHWALKESYVKNIGVGITVDLQQISFNVIENVTESNPVKQTTLSVDNRLLTDWLFEESIIGTDYCVAVSLKQFAGSNDYQPQPFQFIDFNWLLNGSDPILDKDFDYCNKILEKEYKTT